METVSAVFRWIFLFGAFSALAILSYQTARRVRGGDSLADALDSSWIESRQFPLALIAALAGHLYSLVLYQGRPLEPTAELIFSFAAALTGLQLYMLIRSASWKPLTIPMLILIVPAAGSFLVTLP